MQVGDIATEGLGQMDSTEAMVLYLGRHYSVGEIGGATFNSDCGRTGNYNRAAGSHIDPAWPRQKRRTN
jgi:hypothetical protein